MELTDYSLKLESVAKQKFMEDKQRIGNALNGFGIKNILHFTHVTNLVSILTNGLKSFYDLNNENLPYHSIDKERRDLIYQGICCSLAYPNIYMMNKKLGSQVHDCAILEFMENTLLLQHFVAFPGNAATNFLREDAAENPEKYVGIEGLRRMFLNKPLRKKEVVLKHEPTDLQSELIFFNKIDADRVRTIHFPGMRQNNFESIYKILEKDYPEIKIEFQCLHNFFYKESSQKRHDGRRFKMDWT